MMKTKREQEKAVDLRVFGLPFWRTVGYTVVYVAVLLIGYWMYDSLRSMQ